MLFRLIIEYRTNPAVTKRLGVRVLHYIGWTTVEIYFNSKNLVGYFAVHIAVNTSTFRVYFQ